MLGLQALVQSCRARQPELVQQVESMMTELEHMSVLWAEQWHLALLELQVPALLLCIPAIELELYHSHCSSLLDLCFCSQSFQLAFLIRNVMSCR